MNRELSYRKKRAGGQPSDEPKAALPFSYQKSVRFGRFFLPYRTGEARMGKHKGSPPKSRHGRSQARF